MEGDSSEKPVHLSSPASSHGDSTDDTATRSQLKQETQTGSATPNEFAELQKLDSEVIKVDEKEDDPFKHLPPNEAEILKRQLDIPVVQTNFRTLFRYATTNDKIILGISVICSIAGGAALPLMTVCIPRFRHCVFMLNFSRSSSVIFRVLLEVCSKEPSNQTNSVVLCPPMSCTLYTLPLVNL
jgi:hypothetical protein